MTAKRAFWRTLNFLLGLFFALAVAQGVVRGLEAPLVVAAVLVLLAHVLELPAAFRAVAGRDRSEWVTMLMTLLFGFTWWVPVRRGIY
ncbi:MAG TPA: hypothetical protein VFA86_08970 [Gammaproteobacteria bacterium]|nr:hypothetical protein [Gammaproteobacteria bacterium]